MPVSAPFIDEVFLSVNDNNISFTFSALNVRQSVRPIVAGRFVGGVGRIKDYLCY